MIRKPRGGQSGVTLIETLVVLSVIGVAAGATMMAFGDRSQTAEVEALRLARNLTLGVDEALIAGFPLALQWDDAGYSFGQLPPGQPHVKPETWPAADLMVLAERHELASPLELRARNLDAETAVILPVTGAAPTVVFEVLGANSVWTVTFDGFNAVALPEVRQ